jgi:hypothetical protein
LVFRHPQVLGSSLGSTFPQVAQRLPSRFNASWTDFGGFVLFAFMLPSLELGLNFRYGSARGFEFHHTGI